jgi:uncharacterized damage-inducible protein DinB
MAVKDAFIAELQYESGLTKKILERVPLDKSNWKPHAKSMSLGRLATHIAQIPHWISDIIHIDDYDFATRSLNSNTAASKEELMQIYQETLDNAVRDLRQMNDEDFNKRWVVRVGNKLMYDTPKKVALRGWAYSHLVHHRGQLSVYLRLLDIPVPGMYGPSADER